MGGGCGFLAAWLTSARSSTAWRNGKLPNEQALKYPEAPPVVAGPSQALAPAK